MSPRSSQGDVRTAPLDGGLGTFPTFAWLEDDWRPLDWSGPVNRLFTRFRNADLRRPVIEHFERIARRHKRRIAITEGDTRLTFGELWEGVSGLAETLAVATE